MNLQTFEFGEEEKAGMSSWVVEKDDITVEAIPLFAESAPTKPPSQDLALEKLILQHNYVSPLDRRQGQNGTVRQTSKRKRGQHEMPSSGAGQGATQAALDQYLQTQHTAERPFVTLHSDDVRMSRASDVQRPVPGPLEQVGAEPVAITYFIKGPTKPGRFNAELAQKLGVFGADRSRLVRGETVVLPDGSRVRPDQVLAKAEPGAVRFHIFPHLFSWKKEGIGTADSTSGVS